MLLVTEVLEEQAWILLIVDTTVRASFRVLIHKNTTQRLMWVSSFGSRSRFQPRFPFNPAQKSLSFLIYTEAKPFTNELVHSSDDKQRMQFLSLA